MGKALNHELRSDPVVLFDDSPVELTEQHHIIAEEQKQMRQEELDMITNLLYFDSIPKEFKQILVRMRKRY